MAEGFRDLEVWRRAMTLVERCYQVADSLPSDERFGLSQQLRRAAVSVPSNIAEGHGLRSTGNFVRHLWIAHGALAEVSTQVELTVRLGSLAAERVRPLLDDCETVSRMIYRLIKALERDDRGGAAS